MTLVVYMWNIYAELYKIIFTTVWVCRWLHPKSISGLSPTLTLVSSLRRFLAAEASSCSAASCFSLSSSCFFSIATGSPFWVAWKHTYTERQRKHSGSNLKHSHSTNPRCDCLLQLVPNRYPPFCQDWSVTYHVPGVLNDANFLRQDLDEPLSFSLTKHHASDSGDQSLIGQVQRGISRIHHCCLRSKNKRCERTLKSNAHFHLQSKENPQSLGSLNVDLFHVYI